MRATRPSRIAITSLALSLLAAPAAAQRSAAASGTLTGDVIDAESAQPLAGSTIVLRLAGEGAIVAAGSEAPTIVAVARQTVTASDGRYRFDGLAAGRYQLHVQRLGYRATTLEVELRGAESPRVSVGLVVVPIRLARLPVEAAGAPAFQANDTARSTDSTSARVRAARERQRRFAGTDVRELTEGEVLESGSLGETDLFRALQRLPGVATFGDYTAELWTRGGRWDATRVYLDGLPLFAPLHVTADAGTSTITGVAPDVLGGALLFPGVRPASIGEGSAAALDLRSRPAVPDGDLRGVAELTLLSGRLAMSRGNRAGTDGWSVAARHYAGDLFRQTNTFLSSSGDRRYFDDFAGRWDHALGRGATLSVTALYSGDHHRGVSDGTALYDWRDVAANTLVRAGVSGTRGALRLEQSIGVSAYAGSLQTSYMSAASEPGPVSSDTLRSRLQYWSLAGVAEPADANAGGPAWRAGYELTGQTLRNAGYLREYRGSQSVDARLERRTTLPLLSVWGERRALLAPRLELEAGARIDAGEGGPGAAPLRAMPRLQLRATPDAQSAISLGVARQYQYAQATPRGIGYNGVMAQHPVWRLADGDTPAQRSDVLTLGGERWIAPGWLAAANAYARRTAGVLLADPRVDPAAATVQPATGRTSSRGVELSVRRLAGRATGTVGYTIARTRAALDGATYPAEEDRPRTLDATLLVLLSRNVRLGAAYTVMSGRPYTSYSVYTTRDSTGTVISWRQASDAPNARRSAPYESLDLLLDWSGRVWGVRTGAFLQLRNVLGHEDLTNVLADPYFPACAPSPAGEECRHVDYVRDNRVGPFTPMAGVRIAF